MDDADPRHDLFARCAAVLDLCSDDSLICGTTAARLHGFWLPALPDEIHVAVSEPATAGEAMIRSRRHDVRAHRRQLKDDERVRILGVAVTAPMRTWLDLASILSLPALVAAGDSMLRAGVAQHELAEFVRLSVSQRGVRRARSALHLLDGRSRSRPESHLRVATVAPDLPRFEVNEAVYRDEGGWLAEPDLSLAPAKIALEYQGSDHADVQRQRRDISRATDLRHEGWAVIEYGPAEVFGRSWQILPELRSLIRYRSPQLLTGIRRPRRRAAA